MAPVKLPKRAPLGDTQVFMGYRTIIARYVAKRGVAQMCLCEAFVSAEKCAVRT